jgi:hypothetical protein
MKPGPLPGLLFVREQKIPGQACHGMTQHSQKYISFPCAIFSAEAVVSGLRCCHGNRVFLLLVVCV